MRICHLGPVIVSCGLLCAGCLAPTGGDDDRVRAVSARPSNRILARDANERGLTLAKEGDFDRAEVAFREAITADRQFASAHNNLGLVLMARGRLFDAAAAMRTAMKLRPTAKEPIVNLTRLYQSIGWDREAERLRERLSRVESHQVALTQPEPPRGTGRESAPSTQDISIGHRMMSPGASRSGG